MIKVGTIVTLPFHPDGDSEFLTYEVEALISSPANGEPAARLIRIRDGKRDRSNRGHFARQTREIAEIERWN